MTDATVTQDIWIDATDPRYDQARRAWNLTVDQRPAAVAMPADADDLVAVVERAASAGLRVAMQSTGHGAAPLGALDRTVLTKTTGLTGVTVAPSAMVAHVGAGATWGDVVEPAARHGLVPLAGSAHDVGVVGYSLGGGVSTLSRRYGLASRSILAADVVTADGRTRRVDSGHDPELFWALRGGGGSFAAVTGLDIQLYPIRDLVAGMLFFPVERAADVLRAWLPWVADLPEEMSSSARLLQFPPLPHIPDAVRGRSFAAVEVVHIGTGADADALLAPLRALGPVRDTVSRAESADLLKVHLDPPGPVKGVGDGILVDDLPAEAVDALLRVAGPESGSRLMSVELRHLGGAMRRPADGDGAVGSLDAAFSLFAVGMAPEPAAALAVRARIGQVKDALAPWRAPRDYLNYVDSAQDPARFFAPDVLARLRRVKQDYDPANLFQGNHPVDA